MLAKKKEALLSLPCTFDRLRATLPNHAPLPTAEGSGGAYLHSGVAVGIENCIFVGNRAGDEGLAILSLGIAEKISGVEFDSNSFYCSSGTYGYEMDVPEAEVR